MAHLIERASTGRAKCRACKQSIGKGTFRLGEEVPNAFGDGTATHWYHVECGARQRALAFLGAWDDFKGLPEATEVSDQLLHTAELGRTYYRLQRFIKVELAPSGRARCQGCRSLIEKGALRFVLQRIEDGMAAGAGFVHVACAHSYAGAVDEMEERVLSLSELDAESWTQVKAAIAQQLNLPREVKIPYQAQADSTPDP
jgi:hypothetical protein